METMKFMFCFCAAGVLFSIVMEWLYRLRQEEKKRKEKDDEGND